MQNILAFGFNDDIYFEILRELSKMTQINHLEYYHDGNRTKFEGLSATLHGLHYIDIQSGNYELIYKDLTPLDAKLVADLSECEQASLRMLDRNKIYAPLSYSQRKYLYLKHLRYWNHILNTANINVAIFSNVPHGVFDYIVYSLCKYKGIKTVLFTCPSLLTGRLFITSDWKEPAPELINAFNDLLHQSLLNINYQFTLDSDLDLHFKEQSGLNGKIPTPYHMTSEWFLANNIPMLKSKFHDAYSAACRIVNLLPKILQIKDTAKIKKLLNNFLDLKEANRTYNFYDEHTSHPDLTSKYIYVPLQMQPEMTTSPMAGQFVDQELIVHLLANSIDDDTKIYLKEHPYQHWGGSVSRDIEFYKDLLKIPNLSFIPRNYDTHSLIQNSFAVATATGTAGWEGLFLGKPFLMFGHHIYQYAPGAFQVSSIIDCKNALKKISSGYKVDPKQIKLFLKAIELTSLQGPTDSIRKTKDAKFDSNSITLIAKKLMGFIKS